MNLYQAEISYYGDPVTNQTTAEWIGTKLGFDHIESNDGFGWLIGTSNHILDMEIASELHAGGRWTVHTNITAIEIETP